MLVPAPAAPLPECPLRAAFGNVEDATELPKRAAGMGQNLGPADADTPRLASDQLLIQRPRFSAVFLEQVPVVADHRIEPLNISGELGQSARDFIGGEPEPKARYRFETTAVATHDVKFALNVPCFGPYDAIQCHSNYFARDQFAIPKSHDGHHGNP
jgi:hypothetical protein